MDFILAKIEKNIQRFESRNEQVETKEFYRSRIEYLLYLLLGYLWNKNFELLDDNKKKKASRDVIRPTVGQLIYLLDDLDVNRDFFTDKNLRQLFEKYRDVRNEKHGHGYLYLEGTKEYLQELNDNYLLIKSSNNFLFNDNIYLVLVEKYDSKSQTYFGTKFTPEGFDENWSCPEKVEKFSINSIYGFKVQGLTPIYFKLSPFIHIIDESEYYVYKNVCEKRRGEVEYNRINKDGVKIIEWPFFANQLMVHNLKAGTGKVSDINGTIINDFTPNYFKDGHIYIPIGENKKKIEDFLIGEESTYAVCANLWGHGGVGKTATIQSYCMDFLTKKKRYFNYIIFLSAKDRFFNVYTNKKESILESERIGSFESLILNINKILLGDENAECDLEIIKNHTNGKILLVIDDFETFSNDDRVKIDDFVRKLNPLYHKVIITTRATVGIGTSNIDCNELTGKQTIEFIQKALIEKYPNQNFKNSEKYINNSDNNEILRKITFGRPIRIWQFLFILEQIGDFDEVVEHFLSSENKDLNDFFYDRYYEYLSADAQIVWDVMGQLQYDEDLINIFSKIMYVLKWEDSEDRFMAAISELEKLRVIEVINDERYRIWNKDILSSMKETFEEIRIDSDYFNKGSILQKIKIVNKDRSLSLTENLLLSARESKALGRSLEEIKSSYKHIIGREESDIKTRLKALIDLVTYYLVNLDDRELAIQECHYHERIFMNEPDFVKLFSRLHYEHEDFQYKVKSVEILLQFLNNRKLFNNTSLEDKLELLGYLIVRRKKILKTKSDKLYIDKSRGRINSEQFKQSRNQFTYQLRELFDRYGKQLFLDFKGVQFKDKGKETETITGLRHLAEVCILISEQKYALEICDYIIDNYSNNNHFKNQMITIKKRLIGHRSDLNVVNYEEKIISFFDGNFLSGKVYSSMKLGAAVYKSTGKSCKEIYGKDKVQGVINKLIELDKIEMIDNVNFRVKETENGEDDVRIEDIPLEGNSTSMGISNKHTEDISLASKQVKSMHYIPVIGDLVECKITRIFNEYRAFAEIKNCKHQASFYAGDLLFGFNFTRIGDLMKVGEKYTAIVKNIDSFGRVNLSIKKTFLINSQINCTVRNILSYYALVEFPSIFEGYKNEGRISIREIKDTFIFDINEYLKIGSSCQALVIGNDMPQIDLSIKRLNQSMTTFHSSDADAL